MSGDKRKMEKSMTGTQWPGDLTASTRVSPILVPGLEHLGHFAQEI